MDWVQRIDRIEVVVLAVVSRLGPWLAPIGPAYFVGRAAVRSLAAPVFVGVVMAVSVEVVGIAASHCAFRALSWNREKRASDPVAPVGLAFGLVMLYLVCGVFLAVLVEVVQSLSVYAPAVFFVLAGVAYATLGVMAEQTRLEAAVSADREARRQARRGQVAARVIGAEKPVDPQPEPESVREMPEYDSELRQLQGIGEFGVPEIQARLGRGRTSAYDLVKYGLDRGVVEKIGRGRFQLKLNGNGGGHGR